MDDAGLDDDNAGNASWRDLGYSISGGFTFRSEANQGRAGDTAGDSETTSEVTAPSFLGFQNDER